MQREEVWRKRREGEREVRDGRSRLDERGKCEGRCCFGWHMYCIRGCMRLCKDLSNFEVAIKPVKKQIGRGRERERETTTRRNTPPQETVTNSDNSTTIMGAHTVEKGTEFTTPPAAGCVWCNLMDAPSPTRSRTAAASGESFVE